MIQQVNNLTGLTFFKSVPVTKEPTIGLQIASLKDNPNNKFPSHLLTFEPTSGRYFLYDTFAETLEELLDEQCFKNWEACKKVNKSISDLEKIKEAYPNLNVRIHLNNAIDELVKIRRNIK